MLCFDPKKRVKRSWKEVAEGSSRGRKGMVVMLVVVVVVSGGGFASTKKKTEKKGRRNAGKKLRVSPRRRKRKI